MKRLFTVTIAIILLVIFGGSLLVSLATTGDDMMTPGHTSMADTEHTATKHHCPLMGPGETLCPMDLLAHLALVRGLFEVLVPCLLLLCTASAALLWPYITTSIQRRTEDFYDLTWRWRQRLLVTYSYRQYQDYFASGLLNPKYF